MIKMKQLLFSLIALSCTQTSFSQAIENFVIPEEPYNELMIYDNFLGMWRQIYFERMGQGKYEIIEAIYLDNKPMSIQSKTVLFKQSEMHVLNTVNTNMVMTNVKHTFNPSIVELRLPESHSAILKWDIVLSSGDKKYLQAERTNVKIQEINRPAILLSYSIGDNPVMTKEYYVEKIGLYKIEMVKNGKVFATSVLDKLRSKDIGNQNSSSANQPVSTAELTAIENFSDSQQNANESAPQTLNIAEIDKNLYASLNSRIAGYLKKSVKQSHNIEVRLSYIMSTDIFGDFEYDTKIHHITDSLAYKSLTSLIDTVRFKIPKHDGNTINVFATYDYDLIKTSDTFRLLKVGDGKVKGFMKHNDNGESNLREKAGSHIGLKKYPLGVFEVEATQHVINDVQSYEFRIMKHERIRGDGGARNGWLSMLCPGLGDYFVSRQGSMFGNRTPPAITTALALGGIGSGIVLNRMAMSNHSRYRSAVTQSAMDAFYDKANAQHYASIALIATGSALWLADIIYVFTKGASNSKKLRVFKATHDVAFGATPVIDGMAINANISF